jgi:exodeoxyribonuclease-3
MAPRGAASAQLAAAAGGDRGSPIPGSGAVRIASWNVNSVRARLDRLVDYLAAHQPDVLCLQETKCQDAQFPHAAIEAAGYRAAHHGQRAYNGVAILARQPLEDPQPGLQDGVDDPQARLIAATVGGVRVVSVYAPNGQRVGAEAYAYKLAWYGRLRRYLDRRHAPAERLVLAGDFNVAPEDRDVHDPAGWAGGVLVSGPERRALRDLCGFGLVDTFRQHHREAGRYSWWDYRALAFPRDAGLRIDLVLATRLLAARCTAADIDREARKGPQPSDHTPVWAEFDV